MTVAALSSRTARAVLAMVSASGLVASALIGSTLAPTAAHAAPTRPSADVSALSQAEATGEPVPVPEDTDEYSTVTAMPDGSLQRVVSNVPERLRRGDSWVPVDATLSRNADGTYSPAASSETLTLSGGGGNPLAVLNSHGKTLTLTWPTALPAPTVDAETAVYANVLPDVDLHVTADPTGGISDVLVVKTAAAANNPALASLHVGATASDGLSLATDAGDNINAVDSAGATVFHAPAPLMWDSGTGSASGQLRADATDSADDPAQAPPPGAQVAAVDVATSPGAITLTPDAALLSGADTRFPVYIDPTWTGQYPTFAWVQQAYPGSSNYNDYTTNGEPAAGYQGWEYPYGMTRSFFQFDIGARTDYHILSAALDVSTVHSQSGDADCTSTHKIVASDMAPFGSSIDWNNQPGWYTDQATTNVHTGYASCPITTAGFNVTAAVRGDGNSTLTLRLRADDESNKYSYTRFSHKATLTINYNRIPNVPSSFAFSPAPKNPSNTGCSGTEGWIGATSTVTASAHVSDPDADQDTVQGQFQFWDRGGSGTDTATNLVTYDDTAGHSSYVAGTGGTVSVRFANTLLKNGHRYGSNVRAWDGTDASAGGDACYFWYDNTAPTALTVTSADFSATGSTKHIGEPGSFQLSARDLIPSGAKASGLAHFTYSTTYPSDLDGDGGTHLTPTIAGDTGTATLPYTPTAWGVNYLYVAAVDKAGNQSATATYRFYVPDDPTATVHPGDVDNDSRPDLLAANKNTKNLELYPTLTAAPVTTVVASAAIDSPDGQTWANTLIAHRSSTNQSPTGGRVDDLWALKQGTGELYLYSNNINQPGGLGTSTYYTASHRVRITRPASCLDTDCTGYNTTDWSTVTQLLAPGDVDGDGLPDLITVENGTIWLFTGSTTYGKVGPAHKLRTGMTGYRIVAPGDSTGDGIPDLWALNDNQAFDLLYTTRTAGDTSTVTLTNVHGTDTAYSSTDRPLITSPGDADGDGIPDLYTTCPVSTSPTPQLWANMGTTKDQNPPAMTAHRVVDDVIDWSAITNLA